VKNNIYKKQVFMKENFNREENDYKNINLLTEDEFINMSNDWTDSQWIDYITRNGVSSEEEIFNELYDYVKTENSNEDCI
jgi:hypothetical protein